jgi:uncharacterized membrane protein
MNNSPPFGDRGGFFLPAHHHGGPGALAWTIFALQLLLVLGLGALLASAVGARWRRPAAAARVPQGDALETLRFRYARGEIDREAFLQASADLSDTSAGT